MIIGLTSAARVNPYATLLIDELHRHGLPVSYVLTEARGAAGDLLERLQRRGVAGVLRALRRRTSSSTAGPQPLAQEAAARGLDLARPLAQVCADLGIDIEPVVALSGRAAADAVRRRSSDLLINAGGGLFRRQLLQAPRLGMLNAHMARLPQLRGVDVLAWSALLGVQPGITVHWIDGGVDTGDVLAFEALPSAPGDADTMESLRERAVLASARVMVEQVARLAAGGPTETQPGGPAGPQYFALHPRLLAQAARCLQDGDND